MKPLIEYILENIYTYNVDKIFSKKSPFITIENGKLKIYSDDKKRMITVEHDLQRGNNYLTFKEFPIPNGEKGNEIGEDNTIEDMGDVVNENSLIRLVTRWLRVQQRKQGKYKKALDYMEKLS